MYGADSSLVLPGSAIAGDFSQMRALVQDLSALGRELQDSSSIVHRMNNIAGVPIELSAALGAAEQDWTAHRQALCAFLHESAQSVRTAMTADLGVEQDIIHAARPAG
jgi:hypothetical protein